MENSAVEDKSLSIVAVVDKSMKYSIKVSSATSEEVGKAIGEVLKGDFLSGVTDLITVGLNAMLGNESVGETEKQDFHVVFANNSLLRIDCMFYKYEFSVRLAFWIWKRWIHKFCCMSSLKPSERAVFQVLPDT